jgi:carbohydrate kinase (thermoresistant glucokinase family)
VPLLTVGHGSDDRDRLGARLTGAGVGSLIDVRRFPGSRTNADVQREAMSEWLPPLGIGYRWEERLGGRRRLPRGEAVADGWWTVAQFAAYAAHSRTPEFLAALDEVLTESSASTVAVLCSESVWWRCHRRLIADVAVLGRGVPVSHLMPDGRLVAHQPSPGAVVGTDGLVRWPAQELPCGMANGPTSVVVMGVSGSGKTTIAEALADRLGWEFTEGDSHHPPANVEKMRAGVPLDDADRAPWLAQLASWIGEREAAGRSVVLTCSALKRTYRDRLRAGNDSLWFVHVDVPEAELTRRMAARTGHYMPASLLGSQLAALEPLGPDEPGVTVPGTGDPSEVTDAVLATLTRERGI